MSFLLVIALLSLAAAVPAVALGLGRARTVQAGHHAAMRYLGSGPGIDGSERELGTASRWFASAAGRLTPGGFLESVRGRLSDLGSDLSAERFLAYKGMAGFTGGLVGLWTIGANPALGLAVMATLGPVGFFYPDVWLRRHQRERAAEIRRALPDSLDLMAISVEAGVGLEGALARAAEDLGGALGEEYSRLLREMQLGASRREAFTEMRRRIDVPEMTSFVMALLQADSLGIAVGKVLRTQANEQRTKRRQRAREQAAKTPVKILFPLIFGIFPALLIVILGPAIIRIMGTLFR
jgi:tight adherence protein C